VVSEGDVQGAIVRKKRQYEEILRQLRAKGVPAVLHVIPVGARGFIPHHTVAALKDLGLNPAARKAWELKVSRLVKTSCVGLMWGRRKAEMELGNADVISGFYRYQQFRKLKRHLIKVYPPASARPPGGSQVG
jgi:hypothetical protein